MNSTVLFSKHALERIEDRLVPLIEVDACDLITCIVNENLKSDMVLNEHDRKIVRRIDELKITLICHMWPDGRCLVVTIYCEDKTQRSKFSQLSISSKGKKMARWVYRKAHEKFEAEAGREALQD